MSNNTRNDFRFDGPSTAVYNHAGVLYSPVVRPVELRISKQMSRVIGILIILLNRMIGRRGIMGYGRVLKSFSADSTINGSRACAREKVLTYIYL